MERGAQTGAGFLAGLVTPQVTVLKDCASWKRLMLEQLVQNCSLWEGNTLKKVVENYFLWEASHTGAGEECEESHSLSLRTKVQQRKFEMNVQQLPFSIPQHN